MNFRTTVILIILLAIVGVWLFISRTGETETEPAPGEQAKLISSPSEDVTRIAVTPRGEAKFVLEKVGGDWRVTEPVSAPASRYEVDRLVTDIVSLSSRGKVSAEDASAAGLDQPQVVVEAVAKDGKTHKLSFGQRSAVGDHGYVRLDDDARADVISAEIYELLDKPLSDFRETKLVNAPSNEIRQITVREGDRSLSLQKNGEEWRIVEPKAMPADSSTVSDLTFAITGLNAAEFVSEDAASAASYGLDQPVLTVKFSTAPPATQPADTPDESKTTTLAFGRFDDILKKNVYASISGSPSIVKVPATSLDAFRKTPLALRNKKVLTIDPDAVTSFSIESNLPATTQPTTREASSRDVRIERHISTAAETPATSPTTAPTTAEADLPAWIFAGSTESKVRESKVNAFLAALNPLEAAKFLETAPPADSADTYLVNVTTEAAGAKAVHEIRVTSLRNASPLIGTYGDLVFELDRSLLSKLEGDFIDDGTPDPAPAPPPAMPGGMMMPGMGGME
jgi:hypothetical protein